MSTSAQSPDSADSIPGRFTLLDLMFVVLAYGVGFGFTLMIIPREGGAVARLITGCVIGSILLPPLELMRRTLRPPPGQPLSLADRLAQGPFIGLMTLFLIGRLAPSFPGLLVLFLTWCVIQIMLGLTSVVCLIELCFSPRHRRRTGWLGLFGYVLNLGMMVPAGIAFFFWPYALVGL